LVSHSLSKLLLLYAQQFEDQHAPQNVTIALREASAEIDKLRGVLQRVRRFGSPMIKGYIDGALGRQAGGSDPLGDDQVGGVGEQGAQG
jgi:hypothetical protein